VRPDKLTEREKVVLHGLLLHPEMTDASLSELIDVNASTIATIRNRMKETYPLVHRRIPNLLALEGHALLVTYGRYRTLLPPEERHSFNEVVNRPGIPFFSYSKVDTWFAVNGCLSKWLEGLHTDSGPPGRGHGPWENVFNLRTIRFVPGETVVYNLFDYSHAARVFLGVEGDGGKRRSYPSERHNVDEREVFFELAQSSTPPDYRVAEVLPYSHATISRIRKRFMERGLLQDRRIPPHELLGINVMGFFHLNMAELNDGQREDVVDSIAGLSQDLMFIYSRTDLVMVTVHRDFADFSLYKNSVFSTFYTSGVPFEQLVAHAYDIPTSLPLANLDFSPYLLRSFFRKRGERTTILDDLIRVHINTFGRKRGKRIFQQFLEEHGWDEDPPLPELAESLRDEVSSGTTTHGLPEEEFMIFSNDILRVLDRRSSDIHSEELKQLLADFDARTRETVRVFLAEPSEGIIRQIMRFISGTQFRVVGIARDARSVLTLNEWLRKEGTVPSILLVDETLPGMDVRRVAQRMRESNPGMFIVLLKGRSKKGSESGVVIPPEYEGLVDAALPKPIVKRDIIGKLGEVIRSSKE